MTERLSVIGFALMGGGVIGLFYTQALFSPSPAVIGLQAIAVVLMLQRADHIRPAQFSCGRDADGGWPRANRPLPLSSSPDLRGGLPVRVAAGDRQRADHTGRVRTRPLGRGRGADVLRGGVADAGVSRLRRLRQDHEADDSLRVLTVAGSLNTDDDL